MRKSFMLRFLILDTLAIFNQVISVVGSTPGIMQHCSTLSLYTLSSGWDIFSTPCKCPLKQMKLIVPRILAVREWQSHTAFSFITETLLCKTMVSQSPCLGDKIAVAESCSLGKKQSLTQRVSQGHRRCHGGTYSRCLNPIRKTRESCMKNSA